MNNFTKKGIVQKIIIALVCLTVFNFIYPYISSFSADIETQNEEAPGGILMSPIIKLTTAIGEGIIAVVQTHMLGMGNSFIYVDMSTSFGSKVKNFFSSYFNDFNSIGEILLWNPVTNLTAEVKAVFYTAAQIPDDFYIPMYFISPAEIFSDKIPQLSVNFINPKPSSDYVDSEGNEVGDDKNSALILSSIVSKWYVSLRNIVLVGLMVVLLYIGIRIIISTTASEKAKYKENIKDWLIAVIILVFMHYIMAFSLTIVENITNMLSKQSESIPYTFEFDVREFTDDIPEKYIDEETGYFTINTNLMGQARLKQQLDSRDSNGNETNSWLRMGFTLIYIVLVIYTLMFLVIYFKRVVYMAFLTMIAPLVALTYPIDKLKDGQAQAFDMWIKEYMFNLLLQPFHLLLYTILIGSVMELASSNMVYALVALGFLLPAEKLLRKFFGFEKAGTTGAIMGGAAGGALAMTAINKLGKLGSSAKNKATGKGNSSDDDSSDSSKIRTADSKNNTDDLLAEGLGGNNEQSSGGNDGQDARVNEQPLDVKGNPVNMDRANRFRQLMNMGNDQDEALNILNEEFPEKTDNHERNNNHQEDNSSVRTVTSNSNQPTRLDGLKSGLNKVGKTKVGKVAISGAKTLGAGARVGARYTGKGLVNMAKKAPRMVAKAYGAATLGTLGVAAGLASDDYKNVLTYGVGAGAVGYGLGNKAADLAGGATSGAKKMKEDYMKERYTNAELKQKNNKKLDDEFLRNRDSIKLYKEQYGKEYKERMKDALEYRKHGVTSDKTIIKAMELKDVGSTKTSKERIAIAKVASSVKTNKELDDYGKRLEDNGVNKGNINKYKRIVRDMNDI